MPRVRKQLNMVISGKTWTYSNLIVVGAAKSAFSVHSLDKVPFWVSFWSYLASF